MIQQGVQPTAQSKHNSEADELDPLRGVDFSKMERSLRWPRTFLSMLFSVIISGMTLLAMIPLFSVVELLLWRGGRKLSIAAFTQLPPAPLEQNGGFGNAILGTLVIVAMATLISVLFAIAAASTCRSQQHGATRSNFPSHLRFLVLIRQDQKLKGRFPLS